MMANNCRRLSPRVAKHSDADPGDSEVAGSGLAGIPSFDDSVVVVLSDQNPEHEEEKKNADDIVVIEISSSNSSG